MEKNAVTTNVRSNLIALLSSVIVVVPLFAGCGSDDMAQTEDVSNAGTNGIAGTGAPTNGGTSGSIVSGRAGAPGGAGAGRAAATPMAAGTGGAGVVMAGSGAGTAGMPPANSAGAMAAPMAGASGMSGGMPMAGSAAPMAGAGPGKPEGSSCLDGITNYDSKGPFEVTRKTVEQVKMWVPGVPAGCKVPIVHFANGTGANCGVYSAIHERYATHGFLVACYENPNTGAGTQGVKAFELTMQTYPDLHLKALGSTGHSQGGMAAFTVLSLSEAKWGMTDYTYAGLAMQPASGYGAMPAGGWQSLYAKIKSPMFAFDGTADTLVSRSWVSQGYNALSKELEAYHWSAIRSTHVPPPTAHTMQVGVAWWRWKLLGDKAACEWFKKLPDGPEWDKVDEQNVRPCE